MVLRAYRWGLARAGALALGLLVLIVATPHSARADELCNGSEPFRIHTVVEGLRSLRGKLVVEIYPDDANRFLGKKQQVTSIHTPLTGNPTPVCLAVPGPGGYAVAVFHDENDDRKFNRNAFGLPSEGFGLSNNPPLTLGKPSFKSVRFEAGQGETTIHIRMRYITGGGGTAPVTTTSGH